MARLVKDRKWVEAEVTRVKQEVREQWRWARDWWPSPRCRPSSTPHQGRAERAQRERGRPAAADRRAQLPAQPQVVLHSISPSPPPLPPLLFPLLLLLLHLLRSGYGSGGDRRKSLAPSLASLYPCDMSNVSLVGDNNVGAAG